MIAADVFWNGRFNNSWHQEFNWAPIGFPFSIRRVPADFDNAILNTPNDDDVLLFGDTTPINGLSISNEIHLNINGYRLTVDDGGSAMTTVSGVGSLLSVAKYAANSSAISLDADCG